MNATELEAKYVGHVKQVGGLLLLTADDAVCLLDDCADSEIHFLGVEALRLFDDGKIQPAMEYSNIAFGSIEERENKLKLVAFERVR